ncbi:MAG TPA: hypothetical protein VND64_23215 [Pirellulales bacterium]|nr:hypothetical protein [Pirellulales bacterium]
MNSAAIRLVIDSAVAELGHAPCPCKETMLIRGSRVLGRQYKYHGVRAIWSADDEAVKFYTDDGRLLQTLMGIGLPVGM